jgi:hypothetical protein
MLIHKIDYEKSGYGSLCDPHANNITGVILRIP